MFQLSLHPAQLPVVRLAHSTAAAAASCPSGAASWHAWIVPAQQLQLLQLIVDQQLDAQMSHAPAKQVCF